MELVCGSSEADTLIENLLTQTEDNAEGLDMLMCTARSLKEYGLISKNLLLLGGVVHLLGRRDAFGLS